MHFITSGNRRHILWLGTLLLALMPALAAAENLPAEIDRCPFTGRYPVEIEAATPFAKQALFAGDWELDIDDVRGRLITAYIDDAQHAQLSAAGYAVRAIPNQARRAWAAAKADPTREDYHDYAAVRSELTQIANDYPEITELFSIGASVEGRQLWMLKISDNVETDEAEPEFKYTATMHGDEPPGTEMCIYLIRLLTENYGIDPDLTALVDDLEIYICPLHNPDGNEHGTRYNADGHDLNREFPRVVDPDDPSGRPIEVQHMMNFVYDHNFILGANYHTGALVANYPWDSMYGQYTPDDDLFEEISLGYSYRNPPMWNSSSFPNGVVIGWEWYVIYGGMQDWSYHWRNEMHVTLEISNTKWPSSSVLAGLWDDNRDAMLWYMAQARIGVEGFVTDAVNDNPVKATISVTEIGKDIWGEREFGFYHRMLLPGTYTLQFSADGYQTYTENGVVVVDGTTTMLDVQLQRDASWNTVSGTVTEDGSGDPLEALVSVYDHDTGELFDTTASDPMSGFYAIDVPGGEFDFTASADGHAPVTETRTISGPETIDFALPTIQATVLLVKDNNATTNLSADLTALEYLVTEKTNWDTDPVNWPDYDVLVWSAGSYKNPLENPSTNLAALESYVAAGGKLLIESGEIGYDALINPGYSSFATNVLHVGTYHSDFPGDMGMNPAQSGHPMINSPKALPATVAVTNDYFGDQDAVTPLGDATLIYATNSYPNDGGVILYEPAGRGIGQIAYYAFDYNALTSATVAKDLLENTLHYLIVGGTQSAPEEPAIRVLSLSRPLPTPTQGAVHFDLLLPETSPVRLALYDAAGRQVRSLQDGPLTAGAHRLAWDGRDGAGRAVSPGVYFLKAVSAHNDAVRQIVVVR
ncbi:MAG: carboxypeptidase regulatory-like domain-containing protein [Candidatus Eisenbacteria sp.]|nr:carboxypeptidase regulatory-like domain-containing protein [Candidatus Eisenbacteria bacterium]